jgi:hypothetical protein
MNSALAKKSVPLLRWVLGLVVILESGRFVFSTGAAHFLQKTGLPAWIQPALGISEAVAALLFLLPFTALVGSCLLLVIFVLAALLHVLHGQIDVGGLLVYAAAVLVSMTTMANRPPGRSPSDDDMADDTWMEQFESATLPNDSFHHADHVKMAFLYLRKYPAPQALDRFSSALARFAKAHGKSDRYNETVTWAFLFLIRERAARAGCSQSWEEFAASNADLLRWDEHILKQYYRPETLDSALAKRTFLFPDRF